MKNKWEKSINNNLIIILKNNTSPNNNSLCFHGKLLDSFLTLKGSNSVHMIYESKWLLRNTGEVKKKKTSMNFSLEKNEWVASLTFR
jgi:hypothetical protein